MNIINTIIATLLLCYFSPATHSKALEINDKTIYYDLFSHLQITSPKNSASTANNFPAKAFRFSTTRSSYSAEFSIKNHTTQRQWAIFFNNIHMDKITLYKKTPKGIELLGQQGRRSTHKPLKSTRLPVFFITLDQHQKTQFQLRIEFDDSHNTTLSNTSNIRLATLANFFQAEQYATVYSIFFFSTYILFLLFFLILCCKAYLPTYNYFFLYLLGQIGSDFYYQGINYHATLIPDNPVIIEVVGRALISVCYIGLLSFIRKLLSLKQLFPLFNKIYIIFILLNIFFIPLALLQSHAVALIHDACGLLIALSTIIGALYIYMQGHKIGLYLAISILPLIIGLFFSNIFFYFPIQIYWLNVLALEDLIYSTGVILQVILLSLVLAYHIKTKDLMHEQAQLQIRKQTDYIKRLEKLYQQIDKPNTQSSQQIPGSIITNNIKELPEPSDFLQKAKHFIEKNLANSCFDVKALANALHVSETTLRRRLEELSGYTPAVFIRLHRLFTAKQLLSSGKYQTISQVATAVGFNQAGYFSRLYRKTFNQSPAIEKPTILKKSTISKKLIKTQADCDHNTMHYDRLNSIKE